MVSTVVRGVISVAHIGPFHDGVHGHTWHVEATFRSKRHAPPAGADLEAELRAVLKPLDHGLLDDRLGRELATSEGIACHVLEELRSFGASKVVVSRDDGPGAVAEW